jgi:predicted dehydrogenase
VKFLIAGLGSIGRRHLRNLLALGEDDILLYRTRLSTLPDDELAAFPSETDLDAALTHQPDAVIISNPTSMHLEVAIPAAQAGCHLLIEKPISHSLQGLDELRSAVQRNTCRVLTGFQFRFHPGLRKIADLLNQAAIGQPLSVRAHWGEYLPGWHPWEDYRQGYSARQDLGGGVILTLSHPLDYLRWLFGEVKSLWCFSAGGAGLGLDVEDTAEISLQFADGVIGSLHLDYNQRPPAHHLEIIGTQGTLRWDNADGAVHLYRNDESAPSSTIPAWEMYPLPAGFERNHLFLAELRHFIQVVRGKEKSLCTLEDGIQALRLADAAKVSAQEGRLVTF